jgi:hypothetical protein
MTATQLDALATWAMLVWRRIEAERGTAQPNTAADHGTPPQLTIAPSHHAAVPLYTRCTFLSMSVHPKRGIATQENSYD